MSGTAEGPVDWGAVRRARRAYRLLFLAGVALYAASHLTGDSGSAAHWVRFAVLAFLEVLVLVAFLYYFLKTAGLLGYSGTDRLGLGLLCLVPVVNVCAIVIFDLRMGALIARRERAGAREEAAAAAAGETVTPAEVPLVPRLLWSSLVALLVLLISVWAAFAQYQASAIHLSQAGTLRDIGKLQAAIEAYREETGALPRTLREVATWSQADESWNIRVDDTGAPIDSWRRPLRYSTDGITYRIVCYGYDRRPGGTGLYYDLSNDDLGAEDSSEGGTRYPPVPVEAYASFRQFVTDTGLMNTVASHMHGSGLMMVLTCVLASVATFVVAFLSLGPQRPARRRPKRLAVTLAAIVVAAVYVALTISALHLPSGH